MAQAQPAQAFLLRSVRYGEEDAVLTLLTREQGKVSCLARYAARSRRRYASALQPFIRFEAMLRPRAGGLAFLEGALALEAYPGLLGALERLSLGYRLLELSDQLEQPGAVHHEFFDALREGLAELGKAGTEAEASDSALRCEARLLALSGWAPRLDACVACRRQPPFSRFRLSLSEGGLLCPDCRGEGAWLSLDRAEAGALAALFGGPQAALKPALRPLRRFVEYQLGKALRSEDFEKKIGSLP